MPNRLFHYKRFVEAHLISLLAERKVRFSRPDGFNDPWDCRVHYRTPTDPAELQRLVGWMTEMHRKHYPSVSEAARALRAYDLKSNPSKLNAEIAKNEKSMYQAICKQYRVYCLSEKPDSPLMWAHYAASHTGVCLEFDATRAPFTRETGASQVAYRTTYPAYDMVAVGYEPLVTKADAWSCEAEWRLIAEERKFAREPLTMKTDNDFLTLPPGVLNSVIVGSLADEPSRRRIEQLVRTHAPDVVVRQTTVALDRYELIITPPFL